MKHIDTKMIHVGELHSFAGRNVARHGSLFKDEADQFELIRSLYPGWDTRHSAGVFKLGDEDIEIAIRERKAFRETLEQTANALEGILLPVGGETQKVSIVKTEILAAFDLLYKTKKPKFGIVWSNRRNAVWYLVQALRMHLNQDVITDIQCSIDEYENDLEKVRRNIEENELRNTGVLETSIVQKFYAAKVLYEAGVKQTDLRKSFKDGMGQKLWWTLEADRMFKDLRIFDRIQKGEILGAQLAWKPIKAILEGPNGPDADVAAKYFDKPKEMGNRPKMADRAKFEGLSERCPVDMIRDLSSGALADTIQDRVKPYNEAAAAINTAVATILGMSPVDKATLCERTVQLADAIRNVIK